MNRRGRGSPARRDRSSWSRCSTARRQSRAVRSGHKVVVPLGRSDAGSHNTLAVPRLSREEALRALMASGVDEVPAQPRGRWRRSLTSFRRKVALSPEVQQPQWARPAEARALLPLMLVGGWADAAEGDRQAFAAIAKAPYEEVGRTAVRWSNESDPPVRRVGDAWFVVSKEDAWSLLSRYMTPDDFGRFEAVILEVLGTFDPRSTCRRINGGLHPPWGMPRDTRLCSARASRTHWRSWALAGMPRRPRPATPRRGTPRGSSGGSSAGRTRIGGSGRRCRTSFRSSPRRLPTSFSRRSRRGSLER